ncbi:uncharacterized protein BDW47DRAFT_49157 [Aspergillus candidus]|uniref:Uncharacterized protein n=1 Tax=Aspergillus candidus TaxID=41067 RepID=A0A2I2F753_ASPCN|nr:hypothetical protein BDW47DRAFT_49157 [Aspergillus candidus]PLB36418.1 hypothetical protein BDW47DRAFT_49157 [Aspergillus candidus]
MICLGISYHDVVFVFLYFVLSAFFSPRLLPLFCFLTFIMPSSLLIVFAFHGRFIYMQFYGPGVCVLCLQQQRKVYGMVYISELVDLQQAALKNMAFATRGRQCRPGGVFLRFYSSFSIPDIYPGVVPSSPLSPPCLPT